MKMENEIIGSLEAVRSILENAIEGILIAEIESKQFKYANPAICEMFGYSRKELLCLSVQKIHPPDQLQAVLDIFESLARGEIKLASFIPCLRKDGTTFWADISPSKISINGIEYNVGFFSDATWRERAEEALYGSQNMLQTVLDTIPAAVFWKDRNFHYLGGNRTWLDAVGLKSSEAVIGKSDYDLSWERSQANSFREHDKRIMESGIPEYNIVEPYLRADGTQAWARTNKVPLRDVEGKVIGVLGTYEDITERKRMEEALQNTQKLESLGVMAGGIAHDFNNLLSGIFGYIDLARSVSKDSKAVEYLDASLGTMNRAKALTRQLLTFAKGGAPVQKIALLAPLLQETAHFALSGSNIACHFSFVEDLLPCNIDKDQIAQVVDNIVINAQQAMPDGGTIEISALNISFKENEHPPLAKGDYVKVSIKDFGVGIPKEILPRIFDPFFTTKSKGHGLGLATCYSIINRHGGCFNVESEPGKGSTFHFFLPASSKTVTEDIATFCRHKGSGTIIVMDDEAVLRDTFEHMLESFGYSVVCKNDGKEAVDFYVNQIRAKRRCVAMFFDLTIPGGMGGIAAVREVRKLNTEIPIFVVSGYSDDPVLKNPAKYGFTASISKPFTITEIAEILNKYLK
jgi:PAS domain S-box-containing protein